MSKARLIDLGEFGSPGLQGTRRVQVWEPAASTAAAAGPLPVVVFHDGQNLFRTEDSFLGVTWGVPHTMDTLAREGQPALAVGIWNGGRRRLADYSPPRSLGGSGRGEAHLDLIEHHILPAVRSRWAVRCDPAGVALVGSSLGGLSSLWGALSRPTAFGRCGAFSPSLGFGGRGLYDLVLQADLAGDTRFYLDAGTREVSRRRRRAWTRRSPSQHFFDLVLHLAGLLQRRGLARGVHWAVVKDIGGRHTEADWARRLPGALRFLLGGPPPPKTVRARPKRRR